ncbi:DinB family protein [Emticicia sp. TH156]|uniref:DinB family protein n=1 Tax=Emticicia sp. TH156 TaxID=2067454 RepID=UPI000C77D7D1|nr:DinB family protein [Emticicia sp. TH156]PLK45696.1 DinB family protein [Emticicia sp. TH156]
MEKVDKIQWLEKLENEVENHLQAAINTFQNLNEDILLKPPYNGGWSIAQCFEHLNSYGLYYLPQIEKGIRENQEKPFDGTFKSSWLGRYFTRMMRPSNTKKYKALKGHIPPPDLNAHAVMAEFINQQEALLRYLKEAGKVDLNAIRIPISIGKFIKLKLGDVFQFIIAHNERHIQQAGRVLDALKSYEKIA